MTAKIIFQDNHIHTTYSDGKVTVAEILAYNQLHDRLDLIFSDHVDKNTDWFARYAKEIKELRKKYKDFSVKIGCEVKICDESGSLNATNKVLNQAEVIIGSVHHFKGIKSMTAAELFKKELELTKLLAVNKKIDILGHPFSMSQRFFNYNPDFTSIKSVYQLCVKHGLKFEYSGKSAASNIKKFVLAEIARSKINNFSFGSDLHNDCSELGQAAFAIAPTANILVTGAGAGVGQSIIKAIKLSRMKTRIVAVDHSPFSAGLYAAAAAYLVPLKSDPNYVKSLIKICRQESIDIIIPGTDVELEVLSLNKKAIEAKTSAKLIVSNLNSVRIADDKWKTYLFLKKNGFPYPESWLKQDSKHLNFPLVVKPRLGARSIGVSIVKNKTELLRAIKAVEKPIIQEYLSRNDEEYTCGSFFYGGKCFGVITARRQLRDGDTYRAVFRRDPKLEKFITQVGKKLRIFGPCNFQLRKTKNGSAVIFEINCRFSGTTGAASFLGFNVVNALIQRMLFNRPLKRLEFRESSMFRFWNEIFVDLKRVEEIKRKHQLDQPLASVNIF